MRRLLFLISAVLLVALAGCGGSKSVADKAFGDLNSSDQAALRKVLADSQKFSRDYTQTVVQMGKDDTTPEAKAALATLNEDITRASDRVVGIHNDDLRTTLDSYFTKAQAVADSVQAIFQVDNDPSLGGGDQQALLAAFTRSVRAMQAADRQILGRVEKYMTADQRRRVQASLAEQRRRFAEQTGNP